MIYDNCLGDNSYYFPININSDIQIGILGNEPKHYYFLENALKALKIETNLSYSFENKLKKSK